MPSQGIFAACSEILFHIDLRRDAARFFERIAGALKRSLTLFSLMIGWGLRTRLIARAMRAADRARRYYWRFQGKTIHGVVAKAYTAEGALVLVRQTYSTGLHLPGGGRMQHEPPVEATLRELKEEIGLLQWSSARLQYSLERTLSGVPAIIDVVEVRDVVYAFKPTLEIREVVEVDPARPMRGLNIWTRRILAETGADGAEEAS